jgi:NAD(P)-dependent dehydrogenase (short-subunit alcohol dehydrogenase family)
MNGRVAAVLGVGPGLGAAVARRFASEGFAVAMMARREESLAEIRQDIEGDGGTALQISADATDADSVAVAFERVRAELGDPEVLAYNAGAFQMGSVLEVSPAQFDECFRANCAGACFVSSTGEGIYFLRAKPALAPPRVYVEGHHVALEGPREGIRYLSSAVHSATGRS